MTSNPTAESSNQMLGARRQPLVLGNWKMHGQVAFAESLLASLCEHWGDRAARTVAVQVGVCPPFPYLGLVAARLSGSALSWGAQNLSAFEQGAYTGEVSAAMLADVGCSWALVGHSERRALFGETDQDVAHKTVRALSVGLVPVVCVGETLAEREAGQAEQVLARQLDAVSQVFRDATGEFVVAYEPVWAIGTGVTASPAQAQEAHRFLRERLVANGVASAARTRILYGGSVKPGNAAELFSQPDVDGGLIGGASLVAEDFLAICRAALAVA
jgi:triosephosphate isomerase